jgi:probable HAF family extracellular repeat protein
MRLTLMFLAALLLQISVVDAQVYRLTEIGGFDGPGETQAGDINDFGQIVGFREIGSSSHAFLWSNGTITEFGNERANTRRSTGRESTT